MERIAIIGAGFSGLTLAQKLSQKASLTLFEKEPQPGGRLLTKEIQSFQWDQGAQFFIGKKPDFLKFLQPLVEKGILQKWQARFVEIEKDQITAKRQWNDKPAHYIGFPHMQALMDHLAHGFSIQFNQSIAKITKKKNSWLLWNENQEELGSFDWVISTTAPSLTKKIFPPSFAYQKQLKNVPMLPCFALSLGLKTPLKLDWDVALVRQSSLSWISVNHNKNPLHRKPSFILLATNLWSQANWHQDHHWITTHLIKTLEEILQQDLKPFIQSTFLQAWPFANIKKQDGEASLCDEANQLAACGDWCLKGRVEAAFLSAMDLVKKMEKGIWNEQPYLEDTFSF